MSEFDDPALVGLGLALASGLLIGLERGWQQRERPEGHRVAGVRTFALIGLLGGLGGLLAQRWGAGMLIALLVLVGVYLVVGYLVTAHMHAVMGLTTSVAALATFAIGALATSGAWHVSAVAAVVVLALLRFKQLLHAGVGKLSEAEISSGTQLLLISVVVLPVLPDRGFGPYEALNPYRLWWAVVLLAVLSFAGFVLMRSLGRKRGLVFTALLGGIVSSTATTATLARWAGQTPGWRPLAAAGAALACAAMFARMAALVAIAAMAVAGGVLGTFLAARSPADDLPELQLGNPLQLRSALQFAAFLAAVMLAGRFLADRFGDAGVMLTAAASGLVDVDAITLSIGRLVTEGAVTAASATLALFIAASVNQVTKLVLLMSLAGRALAWRVLPSYAAMAAAGFAVALGLT
ncbi:MgtC/SapB family protein [Pseudomonas aeruginosa]|nr:MgtC/SapB family protein [Pseudomonas aeruginosa]